MSEYSKIIGHENIISQLISAVSMSKINHAYIFNGPDGSGKNMLAKAFAQALLCEKQGPEGCGECHFCKQTESGSNPDLIYIRHSKENIISVDDIRESLVQDIQIKPYNGLYKVYIIDEAEKLTVQAQNALLKTIEEPPEYSVIIFLTNNADIFLQTILSRCIVFNLKPLRDDVITDYLIKTYKIADYEVVQRKRKGHYKAGYYTGLDIGKHNLEKRGGRCAAEILRRLQEMAVGLPKLRQYGKYDIRQIKRDVSY